MCLFIFSFGALLLVGLQTLNKNFDISISSTYQKNIISGN